METLTIATEIELPNKYKELNNDLMHAGYKSYNQRFNNVLDYLEKMSDNELSKFLNFKIYNSPDVYAENIDEDIEGIYSIKPIEFFIGNIPNKNIIEIKERLKILKDNPLITIDNTGYNSYLLVLAPKNNFAEENNQKAIDPVVFVHCKINNRYYLLPLTQWL